MRQKTMTLVISYLAIGALTLGVLAGVEHERAERYELAVNNSYQHAFDELVTAVTEVDTALRKSIYATGAGMVGNLCTEVFGKAMTAQMSLGVLPYSSQELEQTAGFLSRVGDYAYMLSKSASAGREVTAEELENLRGLSNTASVLALNLKGLQTDIQDGRLSLTELTRSEHTLAETDTGTPAYAGDSFKLIEQEFPEVPALIYDGPFSEHLQGMAPKALEGLEEVDDNKAREIAAGFLGLNRARVFGAGKMEGDIPCRVFSADDAGGASYSIAVTNKGGKVLSMLSSRPVGSANIGAVEAVEIAKQFLSSAGYSDMAETYHMTQGGILTVNFAWKQGDVLCYSDLVKVSVALDTGAVCGFEARGYLTAHCWRELPEIAVDWETAMNKVPWSLEILSTQLALVPSDGKYETLCHEFKCADEQGQHYIIYVNATTGEQEKILILLEDESGTLTI